MEKMNQDIPFEHQMMFIVKDYDRKVEENMELRKEVEELSAALATQGAELKQAKKELKKMPSLKDKAMQLEAAKRKNEKLTKQTALLHKCLVYVCNQTRHLLAMVEVPGLRDLEQRMSEALKKYDEQFAQFKENKYLCSKVNAGVHRTYSMFVEILEKSPNFEDRGGECSPPLFISKSLSFLLR